MQIAMYKGPPRDDSGHKIGHALTCWWTKSIYSHCELVINDVCYSASARDGGVRSKMIDLASGRWDVFALPDATPQAELQALRWFAMHDGQPYDWGGLLGFVLPFRTHRTRRWFCSEAVAAALELPKPERMTPQLLLSTLKNGGLL